MNKTVPNSYSLATRTLHWVSAIVVIALAVAGLVMVELPSATPGQVAAKFEFYSWHKTVGVLLLFLGAFRLVRTVSSPRPRPLATHSVIEVTIARAVQTCFVVALVILPVTGLLKHLTSMGGAPIWFWPIDGWLNLGNHESVSKFAGLLHRYFAYGLIAALFLHVSGALKHHFIDRDTTLLRMISGVNAHEPPKTVIPDKAVRRGVWLGLALSSIAIAVAVGQILSNSPAKPGVVSQVQNGRTTEGRADAVPHWITDYSESRLTLEIQQQGQPLSARFERFSAEIKLDPSRPSTGIIRVEVDLSSFNSGSPDRDKSAQDKDWFAVGKHATARYESSDVSRLSEDRYRAAGRLTLKGIERPLTLEFALHVDGKTAIADGEAIINRSEFQVGIGDWASDTMIGHKVAVRFHVQARRQR